MVVAAESARDGAPFTSIDDVEVDPQTWRWASTLDVPSLLIRTNRYRWLTPSTWRGVLLWLQDFTDADLSDLLDSVPTESEPQERAR